MLTTSKFASLCAPTTGGGEPLITPASLDPVLAPAALRSHFDGGGEFPGIKFGRFWWEGDGPKGGVRHAIGKKLRPGTDPQFGKAAMVEPLLPLDAPCDYWCADHLLERYDAWHPSWEPTGYVQVNFYLEPGHTPLALREKVRRLAREQFEGLPSIVILHMPGWAGVGYSQPHVHLILLPRQLGPMGWGAFDRRWPNDRGHRELWTAWSKLRT